MEQVIWKPVKGYEDRSVMKVLSGRYHTHRGFHIAYMDGGDAHADIDNT